ncbi:hypothetical protein Tco_0913060, partial [Tanacetum coccineum]
MGCLPRSALFGESVEILDYLG